jgi:triacylglycerol esterase/lipase EstA (alpha/beta hydrolase family)
MQRRHSLSQLFWRSLVALGGNAATALGMYPLANQMSVALWRAARRRPQPARLARAILGEWAMAGLVAAARPIGYFGVPLVRPQARGPRPVILLHGYAMGRANFLLLANRMAQAGLGPLIGFEYWSLGGIAPAAAALAAFVDELDFPGVDLVGHSLGGVIARHYVCCGGGAARVANVVTIGSPHGGTPFSRFGLGRSAVEMAVGSRFVRELATVPVPPSVRFTAIWSRADGLVSSRAQATLAGAEMVEVEGLGHLAMLGSRRVARAIIERLV